MYEGDQISRDTNSGNIYNDKLEIVDEKPTEMINKLKNGNKKKKSYWISGNELDPVKNSIV